LAISNFLGLTEAKFKLTTAIAGATGTVLAALGILDRFTTFLGIIAFAIGAGLAYLTANVIPFFIAPINGIVASIAAYIILIKIIPVRIHD
jgi:cytosine permease